MVDKTSANSKPDLDFTFDTSTTIATGGTINPSVESTVDIAAGEVPDEELPDKLLHDPPKPKTKPKPRRKAQQDIRSAEGQTDVANAQRFVERHGDSVRYCGPWSKWLAYDGNRWKLDDQRRLDKLAKDVALVMFKGLTEKSHPEQFKFAKYTSKRSGIDNMIALARCEVAISHDDLDKGNWLFNCQNGTIDLRTGDIRPHDRADLITMLSPVSYDPDAKCPLWHAFLDTIFVADDSLISYVQRLFGYSLSGVIHEHILPVFWGVGANGKSTLINAAMGLLGTDYSMRAPHDLLMVQKNEQHPTRLAMLFGRRLVPAVETETGRMLAESLVKELTGGDPITARRCREDFWQFMPTHKCWLATNHKPIIRGMDVGIWRRVKLVPFEVIIPPEEQDHELGKKLEAELPGILNWALQGCRDWHEYGLEEPSAVTAATASYKVDMDDVGRFLNEGCVHGEGCECDAKSFHEAFKNWGGKLSQRVLGESMRERGFDKRRLTSGPRKGRWAYIGIGLLSEQSEHSPG